MSGFNLDVFTTCNETFRDGRKKSSFSLALGPQREVLECLSIPMLPK